MIYTQGRIDKELMKNVSWVELTSSHNPSGKRNIQRKYTINYIKFAPYMMQCIGTVNAELDGERWEMIVLLLLVKGLCCYRGTFYLDSHS